MMMMTAKVNIKKLLIGLIAAAALIIALVSLFGGNAGSDPAAVTTMSDNDSRVQFLTSQGWEVTTSPKEASQVKIPEEQSPVYSRYNDLQKSQGYDLSAYAGKNVMRYVYEIRNFPGATEPVRATLLVYKNQIIGGAENVQRKSPLELFEELYEQQNNQPMSEEQRNFAQGLIESIWEGKA